MEGRGDELIGRAAERSRLRQLIADSRHVLVSGPAGIGKTFLVGTVLDECDRKIQRLLPSAATAPLPLAALAPLGGPRHIEPGDVPGIVSWYLDRWTRERRANEVPVLWVDDVQHLDELSASVLRHAVSAGVLQLIVTHRTPDAIADDIEAQRRDGTLLQLRLGPLPDDAARTIVALHAQRELSDDRMDRILELSAGHPLFLRDFGRTVDDDVDPLRHADDVIGLRLAPLAPGLRSTARMIAAAQPVDRRLLDAPELDELVRQHIARPVGAGLVRLDHPLYTAWFLDAMGPAISDVYGSLIERAAERDVPVDPLTSAQWHWGAGRPVPQQIVDSALDVAFSRADGPSALRLAAGVDGARGRLFAAQARALCGDVEDALADFELLAAADDIDVAVDAAMWVARYGGVMLQQHDRAVALLDAVERHELTDHQRRRTLGARLWLWTFATGTDEAWFPQILQLIESGPNDPISYEIALGGVSVINQTVGPLRSQPLVERLQEIEAACEVPLDARCRGAAVAGWARLLGGDANAGIAMMEQRLREAAHQRDEFGALLLSGTTAMLASATGQLDRAHRNHSLSKVASGPDWFRHRHYGVLAAVAVRAYLGENVCDTAELDVGRSRASDLERALAARATTLLADRRGERELSALTDALRLLADGRKRSWIGMFSSELLDARDDPTLLAWVADELEPTDDVGVAAATGDAMRARVRGDAATLADIGDDFERAGLIVAASRMHADVVRLADDGSTSLRGRRGLARCRRRWDGGPIWWIADIGGLPTDHQLDVTCRALDMGVQAVTDELVVSRRTVENHLYRTAGLLGVSGQDELRDGLASPSRDAEWVLRRR
ncbi:MAG: AAA family ATPase [Actinomycetota bacterium]